MPTWLLAGPEGVRIAILMYAWLASFADDRRDDESIAAHCRPIKRNGVQRGFDFLQSRLPRRSFAWRVRKVWTRGQFSRRNH